MNEFDLAKDSYLSAIYYNTNFKDAYNNLACLHLQLDELEEAYENAFIAYNIDPEDAFILDTLGNIYMQKEEYEEALVYYLESIKINSYDVDVLEHLALCYKLLNQFDNMETVLTRIKDLGEKAFNACHKEL